MLTTKAINQKRDIGQNARASPWQCAGYRRCDPMKGIKQVPSASEPRGRRFESRQSKITPSPGGQISGMASHKDCCGWVGGRVWHPINLPKGYHTPSRGQSRTTHAPVPLRAAPGMARGWAAPGRRDATRTPACKIRLLGRRMSRSIEVVKCGADELAYTAHPPGVDGDPFERHARKTRLPLWQGVPPACPFSGSPGVNSGHSCQLQAYTRRSALVLASALIAA